MVVGALSAGDMEGAAKIFFHARFWYLVGFLLRLAFVAPGVTVRAARRLVAIRRKWPGTRGRSSAGRGVRGFIGEEASAGNGRVRRDTGRECANRRNFADSSRACCLQRLCLKSTVVTEALE